MILVLPPPDLLQRKKAGELEPVLGFVLTRWRGLGGGIFPLSVIHVPAVNLHHFPVLVETQ